MSRDDLLALAREANLAAPRVMALKRRGGEVDLQLFWGPRERRRMVPVGRRTTAEEVRAVLEACGPAD